MVHKAEPLNSRDKFEEKFKNISSDYFHSRKKRKNQETGAYIGGTLGIVGGAVLGHKWAKKNDKSASNAERKLTRSLSDEQKKIRDEVRNRLNKLNRNVNTAGHIGGLAGRNGKLVGRGLTNLSQMSERSELNRKTKKYNSSLTPAQKKLKNEAAKHTNIAKVKRTIGLAGGMIALGTAGHYVGGSLTKKDTNNSDMNREDRAYGFLESIKSAINPSISDKKKIVAKRNSPDSSVLDILAKRKAIRDRKERQNKIAWSKGKAELSFNRNTARWDKAS